MLVGSEFCSLSEFSKLFSKLQDIILAEVLQSFGASCDTGLEFGVGVLDGTNVASVGVDVFGIARALGIVSAGLHVLMGTALGLDNWCPVFVFDLVNRGFGLFEFAQDSVLGYNNLVWLDLR